MIAILFIIASALILPGLINRVRAIYSGRKGIRMLQHLYNVKVMSSKSTVYSKDCGFIFKIAPVVYLCSLICAMLFIPLGMSEPFISFEGDIVMFIFLISLSRVALIFAAMDTASSFEGMGASREAIFGALIEPAIFLSIAILCVITGYTSFNKIFESFGENNINMIIASLLLAYIFIKIMIVETGRIPVDDPKTHLELTMIHEVIILDYSGIDLAIITVAGWLKMAIFATLITNTIVSSTNYLPVSIPSFIITQCAVAVMIGSLESFKARNRMSRNSTFILTITTTAIIAFIATYMINNNVL